MPGPSRSRSWQGAEDRRVLIQVSATFALFVAGGLAIQLILRIFHAG